jgi:hypothetical protein
MSDTSIISPEWRKAEPNPGPEGMSAARAFDRTMA